MADTLKEDAILGERVPTKPSPTPSAATPLLGQYVTLSALTEADMPSLWHHFNMPENTALFDYLPLPPPPDIDSAWKAFEGLQTHRGFVLYAIRADATRVSPLPDQPLTTGHPDIVGLVSYLNIDPSNRSIEIGAVMYGPVLQRTAAATEVQYLMLRHVLGDGDGDGALMPPYRRVCWKCNSLNAASRRAALRLGFQYEGCFRKHLIVKGRSRDSLWFSITDDEWPGVKAGFEAWLDESNFGEQGKQKVTLEALRAGESSRVE